MYVNISTYMCVYIYIPTCIARGDSGCESNHQLVIGEYLSEWYLYVHKSMNINL